MEDPHAGARPVVGERVDHGEARAAIGTGDEGIAVAAVGRVEQLGLAGGAERAVGRHRLAPAGPAQARPDAEPVASRGTAGDAFHVLDSRQGWRFPAQPAHEGHHLVLGALDLDLDLARGVANPAGQPVAHREPVDEGTEPYALDHASDVDPERGQAGTHARTCSRRKSNQ